MDDTDISHAATAEIPTRITSQTPVIQAWERHIHAFVELCPDSPTSVTRHTEQTDNDLSDMRVGVKDVIDIKGIATRNGSEACRHAEPAKTDSAVVASLRRAGAQLIGKTTTTEFAFTDPTACRNPYDLTRSPGGSSSGSGAAVAAGMVDMALGTQTAGSLCRPAAYCGVVGLKPTYGVLPTTGVTPLAHSFDTIGIIARSVVIAHKAFTVLHEDSSPLQTTIDLEIGKILLPTQTVATKETLEAFYGAGNILNQSGFRVNDLCIQANIDDIVYAHRTVMNAEAAQAHRQLLHPDRLPLLGPKFRAGLEDGARVSATELEDARGLLSKAKVEFWAQLTGIDIALTLAVPDAAPLMDGTTGFQDWLTPWTVFGGPLVCLPWGLDSLGRPKSVMLAAHPEKDLQVLRLAEQLEQLAPTMPPPTAPKS